MNTVTIVESPAVVVDSIDTVIVEVETPGPQGAAAPGAPTFIQTTQPTVGQLQGFTQYLWWDTSGGDLTLWIEDGAP